MLRKELELNGLKLIDRMKENKTTNMSELLSAYKRGENIIQLLRFGNSDEYNELNRMKYVEIAYDLQSGSYIEAMKDPEHFRLKTTKCAEMAKIVERYCPNPKSLLKAGVGEAVTLVPFLDSFAYKIDEVYGFDISWSRTCHARKFLNSNSYDYVKLCTGTLQEIPFMDNSFDIIMTSHACEPNGGYEEIILKELFRVSAGFVCLFEPSFEFATAEGKERMLKHGYVKDLPRIAEKVGFEVVYSEKLETSLNTMNPSAALILKVPGSDFEAKPKYACPVNKSELIKYDSGFFSPDSYLYYPSINNIPALRKENGIIASTIYSELKLD
jgi:ubiquinone/menaquinone biosynthesis C-methylase UbiE